MPLIMSSNERNLFTSGDPATPAIELLVTQLAALRKAGERCAVDRGLRRGCRKRVIPTKRVRCRCRRGLRVCKRVLATKGVRCRCRRGLRVCKRVLATKGVRCRCRRGLRVCKRVLATKGVRCRCRRGLRVCKRSSPPKGSAAGAGAGLGLQTGPRHRTDPTHLTSGQRRCLHRSSLRADVVGLREHNLVQPGLVVGLFA